jgi:hypothetical protein
MVLELVEHRLAAVARICQYQSGIGIHGPHSIDHCGQLAAIGGHVGQLGRRRLVHRRWAL